MSKALFVEVVLDQSLAKPLDYAIPPDWVGRVAVGMRVEVPLQKGVRQGRISAIKESSPYPSVRPFLRLLSQQGSLSPPLWKLAEWISRYYATPLQKTLKCFTPPSVRKETSEQKKLFVQLAISREEALSLCEASRKKSPAQATVLEHFLQEPKGLFLTELLERLSLTRAPVDALLKKKVLEGTLLAGSDELLLSAEFFPTLPKTLTPEQEGAWIPIREAIQAGGFSPHLIHGVTGSGKTEIYLRAIEEALSLGKSALFLVPEISLTSQMIERLKSRFPQKIALLHHKRSLGERGQAWRELEAGTIQLAIGARSALFAPLKNLGLIVVDEEHDSSYKQSEEPPCYQGRDVAVMRAHFEGCALLLGSATPSLESRYNAQIGKYRLHTLATRATKARLPAVHIVDMKQALEEVGRFSHFSPLLANAIQKRLDQGEQTLLFLNRRGYHRLQICTTCRTMAKCPHCDLSLTYHKGRHLLQCHLCSFSRPPLTSCPTCADSGLLSFQGFGTEHVERSLHALFPGIRTLRMDRDTTQRKNSHEELFQLFKSHKADLLLGTQMIAKGFHFPSVTLVGVLQCDGPLSIPDFRAPESLFQLLIQVAGRAGRSDHLPGEVILQTYFPDHPLFRLAADQDYATFYQTTLDERRLFSYPPFTHLIKLLFSSPDPQKAEEGAHLIHTHLQPRLPPGAHLLPVAPAGHPKVKDLYRFQFLIKTDKVLRITPLLQELSQGLPSLPGVSMKVDVDPSSTFF